MTIETNTLITQLRARVAELEAEDEYPEKAEILKNMLQMEIVGNA